MLTLTRREDAQWLLRTPATNRIRVAGSGCDPLFRHAQGQEGAPAHQSFSNRVSNVFDNSVNFGMHEHAINTLLPYWNVSWQKCDYGELFVWAQV